MFKKIKELMGSCTFISKKTATALLYGMITWASCLIVLGLPVLGRFETGVTMLAMVILACVVEAREGGFALFQFIFDIICGSLFFMAADVFSGLKLIQALGSHFSIPKMPVLIGFAIVALVAQTKLSFKDEEPKKK